jgi:hypothetical protein
LVPIISPAPSIIPSVSPWWTPVSSTAAATTTTTNADVAIATSNPPASWSWAVSFGVVIQNDPSELRGVVGLIRPDCVLLDFKIYKGCYQTISICSIVVQF